jgi:hypothetical protein
MEEESMSTIGTRHATTGKGTKVTNPVWIEDHNIANGLVLMTNDPGHTPSEHTEATLRIEPANAAKRMAVHIYPTTGVAGEWGSLIALWSDDHSEADQSVLEFYYCVSATEFRINTFRDNSGTTRDVVFMVQGGEAGDEVARMMYNAGTGAQRLRLTRPQIPNTGAADTSGRLYFLDSSGNERVQMYCYSDDNFVVESATGLSIKLKTSASGGGAVIDRLDIKGAAAQGSADIDVYENLEFQTVGGKYQSVVFPTKAGAPSDADFNNPQTGMLCIDTTNKRIYVRVGAADWDFAALA